MHEPTKPVVPRKLSAQWEQEGSLREASPCLPGELDQSSQRKVGAFSERRETEASVPHLKVFTGVGGGGWGGWEDGGKRR